jgi:hypothetical protein
MPASNSNPFIDAVEQRLLPFWKSSGIPDAQQQLIVSVLRQALTETLAGAGPVALKVVKGELCYLSREDDQSFGMWCPVTPDYSPPFPDGTQLFTAPPADERDARIAELETKGYCSLSWNGFNLHGDKASITEAKNMLHSHGIVPELKETIKELRTQLAKARGERELKEVKRYKDAAGNLVIEYAPKEGS